MVALSLPKLPAPRRAFVLLIGDDGATLLEKRGARLTERARAQGPDSPQAATLLRLIAASPRVLVRPLLDVLEQQYREFEVPSVGPFDLAKMIGRRLAMTFPETPLTGAKQAGPGTRPNERRYVAAGLPAQATLGGWLERLAALPNPVAPLALWPAEAQRFLAAVAGPEAEGEAPAWRILLSRERASGFRQVVVRGERLIFTRLTPPIEAEAARIAGPERAADGIAENIEREFASTLSYLRRLGFSDADRLELLVITEPAVAELLAARPAPLRGLISSSPAQLARRLGLKIPIAADEGSADLLFAAWFARQPGPALAIDTQAAKQQRAMSRWPRLATATAAALFAIALVWGVVQWLTLADIDEATQAQARERAGYAANVATLEGQVGALGVEPDQLKIVLESYAKLQAVTPHIPAKLALLEGALDAGMAVTKLTAKLIRTGSVTAQAFGPAPSPAAGAEATPQMELLATVRVVPPFGTREEAAKRTEQMLARLRQAMPGYTVTQLGENGSASRVLGEPRRDPAAAAAAADVATDIRIVGPAI